jgi:thioredoxin 1
MEIISSSDEDFGRLVDVNSLALVKFYAEWCGACHLLYPSFVHLSEDERFQNVKFIDFNMETSMSIKPNFIIDVAPSYAILKNGVSRKNIPIQ